MSESKTADEGKFDNGPPPSEEKDSSGWGAQEFENAALKSRHNREVKDASDFADDDETLLTRVRKFCMSNGFEREFEDFAR